MLPRKVWAYWDDEAELPPLEQKCLESWRKHLPDWEIHLVRRGTRGSYLDEADLPLNFEELDLAQRRSDAVRLALLAKYGGVYLDCSIILRENLDWVEKTMAERGLCFLAETHDPTESTHSVWFMAALPDSKFVQAWSKAAKKEMREQCVLRYNRIERLSPEVRQTLTPTEQKKVGFISSRDNGLCMVKGKLNPNAGPIDRISVADLSKHEKRIGHRVRLVKLNRKPREEVREYLAGKKKFRKDAAIVRILEENTGSDTGSDTGSENEFTNQWYFYVLVVVFFIAGLIVFSCFYNKRRSMVLN